VTYAAGVLRICLAVILVAVVAAACQSSSSSRAVSRGSGGGTTAHRQRRHTRHTRRRRHHHAAASGVPAADLPRHGLTPGVALGVGAAQICRSGYAASVRNVPSSEKQDVYARYGLADVPYAHEVDHLVSLELGGSNALANLWPEPYRGRWGAHTKDTLENRLRDLVCAGRIALAHAQRIEAGDWVAAYRRYVGAPPAGNGSGMAPVDSAGFYASSFGTARTIYCADDPGWRGLSRRYLVHFASWHAAHARFPGYHLHQPC
jgi:5-methylcytosine-specific restriction endonuclease McrA